jgi:signal transduction histidine kinase
VADAAAHAVNASRVIVVLHIESGPDLMAVWPPFGAADPTASDVEMPVVDRGERLGSIMVQMPAGHPLRPRERRLMADLADQAAMAFRNTRLTAELSAEVEQLGHRTHELTESRRRLINADDAERSRLERTIARQVVLHLTPLPNRLRQLSSIDHRAPTALDTALLEPLVESLNTALAALREITRGVFPAQLARSGLPTALASLLARTSGSAQLVVEPSAVDRRFDPRVEAATYFCVAEAIHNLGDPVVVVLDAHDDQLQLVVRGRDRGALPLRHMHDRVEAAGGSVSITEQDGHTVIEVRAPTPVAPSSLVSPTLTR